MIMRKSYLHFIGNSYYTTESFISESRTYGVTRRISLRAMARMNWNDVVVCCQKTEDGAQVFMEFPVTRLSGISPDAFEYISAIEGVKIIVMDEGGEHIERECGDYITGTTVSINLSLQRMVSILKGLKADGVDIGMLMVGCRPGEARTLYQPYPVLADVPFRMGFRLFARKEFWRIVRKLSRKYMPLGKKVVVFGQFYASDGSGGKKTQEGDLQEVVEYHKA